MNLSTPTTKTNKKKGTRQNKKKQRQRKPMATGFTKPVLWILGLVIGFALIQTLIVLVKSR